MPDGCNLETRIHVIHEFKARAEDIQMSVAEKFRQFSSVVASEDSEDLAAVQSALATWIDAQGLDLKPWLTWDLIKALDLSLPKGWYADHFS